MRRTFALLLLSLAVTPLAYAAGWKKSYFGATKPGTWARYADQSSDPNAGDMTTTMTRLADDDGQPVIELKLDSNGKYPVVLNHYTLKSGFAVDRDLIDYGKAIVAGSASAGSELQPLDANTVSMIAKAMPQYAPTAVFKGTETVDGKKADRYGYTLKHVGDSIETGDLWLSDAVPFGVVRNTFTIKEKNGKTSTFDRKLTDSGAATPVVAPPTAATKKPAAKSRTLKEAYDEGLIRIDATVDESVKNGEKVHLRISAKEDASPLTVTVPKGKTSLHVDMPLDDFIFEVSSAQTLHLTTDKSAELDVKQTGAQRALKGKFQISTYEGTPLWSGGATIGWVK